MNEDEKQSEESYTECPKCERRIKESDKECPYCEYDLVNRPKIEGDEQKKKFGKERIKTIAIVVLVFLIFCFACSDDTKENRELLNQVETLTNQVSELNTQLDTKNHKIEENEKQIINLQEEKTKIENDKQTLEREKSELSTKVEELEKISATKTTVPSTDSSTSQTHKIANVPTSSSQTQRQLILQHHQVELLQLVLLITILKWFG